MTPIGAIKKNGDLEDALEIVVADHTRDRGGFHELKGAVQQTEKNQAELDAECEKRAEARAQALREAAKETVKVKRKIWQGWF